MKYLSLIIIIIGLADTAVGLNGLNEKHHSHSMKYVHNNFLNPPVEFRSAPLWVWNDKVTKKQINKQLQDFREAGIGGVFIHPRPGLITSYLSEEWNELCKFTVDRGKEFGMIVWLYDENSYPSGFAGGHVPAEFPESYSKGQGLKLTQYEKLPDKTDDYFIILKKEGSNFIDIKNNIGFYDSISANYYLYKKTYYGRSPWHGGFSYVDLLLDGVTEKFIDLTMSGYEENFGEEFGKAVPGIFTDEPNISGPEGIRWTPALFAEFQKIWGYDLKVHLPSLTHEIGDWKRIRHNYYQTLLELFIETWSKPWYDYCKSNNLVWTGHYWEHGWPNPHHGSDNMAMYAWHQMPGIDILMNQYSENVNAQFGNVRAVKELASVANQLGKSRTLSETYGAGGWELTFEDMKRIGDWEYVLGVNFLNQHLSYMTIEGARKRDHPLSFSYHAPWWKHYKNLGDYFARLSLALSQGEQLNRILVIEPTSSAWMYFSPYGSNSRFSEIGPSFQAFLLELERYQIEYDLASENILKDNGRVKNKSFTVGEREYDLVILPPGLENLNKSTFDLLSEYFSDGGSVISFSDSEILIDGAKSQGSMNQVKNLFAQFTKKQSASDPEFAKLVFSNEMQFIDPELIKGRLFHHRRKFEDGQILFLVNTSLEEWSQGSLKIEGGSIKELDLVKGDIRPYPYSAKDNMLTVSFDLPPAGSLLLTIAKEPESNIQQKKSDKVNILKSITELVVKNEMLNSLTIDYCDLILENKEEENLYFFDAADILFKHYKFDGNPWSRAVQYNTDIVDRKIIDAETGFSVEYHFYISETAELSELYAVVEKPELWDMLINNHKVNREKNDYWLDRKFGKFDIAEYITVGRNTVKLLAERMTVHSEIEPIYILGDFTLDSQNSGWLIEKYRQPKIGSWKKNGYPFYSGVISYTKNYELTPNENRIIVKLEDWNGSVAEVKINKNIAGIIAWQPDELDITDYIIEGENEISVSVYGTLKNLLGPHHIGTVRGSAWPASFESAPDIIPSGNEYDFIDYGLFNDFKVLEAEGPPKKYYWKIENLSPPVIINEDSVAFHKPFQISLEMPDVGEMIFYTLDGSEPDESSNIYREPISVEKSCLFKARKYKEGSSKNSAVARNFYLLDQNKHGIKYRYYEGEWNMIPDFSALNHISEGHVYDMDLSSIDVRSSKFGIVYSTDINIDFDGVYNFYTASNDGSKLMIGDKLVVDNDGTHGDIESQGQIMLTKGIYPLKVYYFDAGGSQSLKISYKPPDGSKQMIPLDKFIYPD